MLYLMVGNHHYAASNRQPNPRAHYPYGESDPKNLIRTSINLLVVECRGMQEFLLVVEAGEEG